MNIRMFWFNEDGNLNQITNWKLSEENFRELSAYGILSKFDNLVEEICNLPSIREKLERMSVVFSLEETSQYKLVKPRN